MSIYASNCLTVEQLVARLQKMPMDARVGYPNMEIDKAEGVCDVVLHKNAILGKWVELR